MSWVHYQYAKEIERVLKLSTGLTRTALFGMIDVPDKKELEFGVVLAEMCQGEVPQITTIKPPGMKTVYYHNALAPAVTLPRVKAPSPPVRHVQPAAAREAIRPAQLTTYRTDDAPAVPLASEIVARIQVKTKTKMCPGCGNDFRYAARGRPPILCDDCKNKAIPRCPSCGQPMPRAKVPKPLETV